jgi:predicted  nucleic acid-binding Zn-ribbon protein
MNVKRSYSKLDRDTNSNNISNVKTTEQLNKIDVEFDKLMNEIYGISNEIKELSKNTSKAESAFGKKTLKRQTHPFSKMPKSMRLYFTDKKGTVKYTVSKETVEKNTWGGGIGPVRRDLKRAITWLKSHGYSSKVKGVNAALKKMEKKWNKHNKSSFGKKVRKSKLKNQIHPFSKMPKSMRLYFTDKKGTVKYTVSKETVEKNTWGGGIVPVRRNLKGAIKWMKSHGYSSKVKGVNAALKKMEKKWKTK